MCSHISVCSSFLYVNELFLYMINSQSVTSSICIVFYYSLNFQRNMVKIITGCSCLHNARLLGSILTLHSKFGEVLRWEVRKSSKDNHLIQKKNIQWLQVVGLTSFFPSHSKPLISSKYPTYRIGPKRCKKIAPFRKKIRHRTLLFFFLLACTTWVGWKVVFVESHPASRILSLQYEVHIDICTHI